MADVVGVGLTVTDDVPVTGLEQEPLLTDTKFTFCVTLAAGTVNVKFPEPSRVAVAGVPFNV